MNWTEEDLAKPQVLVDSADGMGHPGTFHFRSLVEEVSNGVYEAPPTWWRWRAATCPPSTCPGEPS
jgi:dihydroxyacid dehydratase/phosphogluconate dehydratase